jgi:hypothetical protein
MQREASGLVTLVALTLFGAAVFTLCAVLA